MQVTNSEGFAKVLNHGFVRLVDHMGSDIAVARAARVSYDAAWRAGDDESNDAKLINFLWEHQHTTPFEAVVFTLEVKAPIFVLRQWHRHRTQSYNELSARYRELPEEFYVPSAANVGVQSKKSKQGRQEAVGVEKLREAEVKRLHKACNEAFTVYRDLLASGWPRELARSVLPVSAYSHMFTTMNLLNLLKFFSLRCDPHAQWEIREYANAIVPMVRKYVPVCIAAWERSTQERLRIPAYKESDEALRRLAKRLGDPALEFGKGETLADALIREAERRAAAQALEGVESVNVRA